LGTAYANHIVKFDRRDNRDDFMKAVGAFLPDPEAEIDLGRGGQDQ
jgi:hypothetical protein